MRTIYKIYQDAKLKNRDLVVADEISLYFKNNIRSITDGIISDIPKISAANRDKMLSHYNLSDADWLEVKKSKEFKLMKKVASPLKLGLIISYMETGNNIFLVYLFILNYSSIYVKYMRNGSHNAMVMKYTIDTADNRTDFKKYGSSLITVVNKKIKPFINNYRRLLTKKNPTDIELRLILQASVTRMNDMFKKLYGKYKANMHNEDVKIMMEYSKTEDGKHILSMSNLFSKLKDDSIESLFAISDVTLRRIGLSGTSADVIKYKALIHRAFPDLFKPLSSVTSMAIDKWMTSNANKLTLDNFRTTFVKSLMHGRGINNIYEVLERTSEEIIEKHGNEDTSYNKLHLRNYLYSYTIMNIYSSSVKLFHSK